jgi:hypothetical protein
MLFASTIALVSVLVTIAACKQGEGERCQVNDDCESPLECSAAKGTCVSPGSTETDDAEVPDGTPPDAPPDAPPDMMPDT